MEKDKVIEIIKTLRSPNLELRLKALIELRQAQMNNLDISSSYKTILGMFNDPFKEVRWFAADIMIAENAKVDPIQYNTYSKAIERLKSDDPNVKINGADWLADITVYDMVRDRDERDIEFAIPALSVSLFDGDPDVVIHALSAIQSALQDNQNISDAFPSLITLISGNQAEPRKIASLILRNAIEKKIDVSEYIPILTKYIDDNQDVVKWAIVDALTYHYTLKQNWQEVEKLLSHNDKDVRQEAAGTLAHGFDFNITPIIPKLKQLLTDEIEEIRLVAARTIVKSAKNIEDTIPTLPIITKQLFDKNSEARIYAAKVFNNIFNLLVGLYDEKTKKKEETLEIWEPIIPALPLLEKAFLDENEQVKAIVGSILAQFYLRTEQSEKIIGLLKKSDEKTEKSILKTLQWEEKKKPSILIVYITDKDNRILAEQFITLAKNNAKELNLSAASFEKLKLLALPPEIGLITSLTRLDLSQNRLTSLPKEIGNLVNLKTLILTQNNLQSLPEEIGNLINLNDMYFYRNELESLPKSIGKLKKLRYLQLIQNNLTSLPAEIGNLENLIHLELQENHLETLPKEIGNLISLKWLQLDSNQLLELPYEIAHLQNLNSIDLSNNKMDKIPELIFKLSALTDLTFMNNNLTELPREIKDLKGLEVLSLRNNKLSSIPKEIKSLPKLRHLDLTNNLLTELPLEMKIMPHLKYLELRGNKLNIPDDILTLPTHASKILGYYFKNREKKE